MYPHVLIEHPNLNLSPEEKRLFGQVFTAADTENIGVVTGDVALKFFPERTKLPSETLGEVGNCVYRLVEHRLIEMLGVRYGKSQTRKIKAFLHRRDLE